MAAKKWLSYGLCIFSGLGVGYLVGVKLTKDKAEEEYEQKIEDIREIYRNDRKASAPKKKEAKEQPSERPEVTTKTSIQMEKLSEKKEKAEEAANRYSKSFKPAQKPGLPPEEPDDDDEEEKDWSDYIHLVDEFPEDSPYRSETLKYYADGVLAYQVPGNRVEDKEIPHLIGEENLKLLEQDDCNEIKVRNDLYQINYTVIFCYEEWAQVVEEEPYKAEI